jgi:hypothetical protein
MMNVAHPERPFKKRPRLGGLTVLGQSLRPTGTAYFGVRQLAAALSLTEEPIIPRTVLSGYALLFYHPCLLKAAASCRTPNRLTIQASVQAYPKTVNNPRDPHRRPTTAISSSIGLTMIHFIN